MTFEKDLKSFIKNHPLFREDAARRKLVYEKTSELNRVAFGTVYKQCSSDLGGYGFHDDDLWPVVGSASGVSLSEIRNRLVHGVVFTPSQQEALFKALIHLRWCVERMVLAALEWPLERSLVGEFLRHMAPYNSWREEQRTLTEQRAQPDGGLSPDAPDEVKL